MQHAAPAALRLPVLQGNACPAHTVQSQPMPVSYQLRVGGLRRRLRALSLRLQRRQQLRRHERLDPRHAQVLRLVRKEAHAPPAVLAVIAQLAAIPALAKSAY